MRHQFGLVAAVILAFTSQAALAQTAVQLGSPDYKPSAENPVGWRGDTSGRFPAAAPPLEWYRRPKGAYNTIHISASKPKGAAAEGQPLNMGMIREWLVAGPFDAKSFDTALQDVTQDKEAALSPAAGDELAGQKWKVIPVSVGNQSATRGHLTLDLAVAFGKTDLQEWQNHAGKMDPVVAYACTYVHSTEACKVRLGVEGQQDKLYLNGAAVESKGKSPTLDLKAGWNTLVVKAASSKSAWNVSVTLMPTDAAGYETRNIQWMTPMPGPSWSSPIVVGDKIFVNADEGTLLCINKADGKVLWMRSTTYYNATAPEERSKFADVEAKSQQLDQLMLSLPADINAAISPDGSNADADKSLQAKIKQKMDLERESREAMGKADKAYETWNNDRGWSIATPVSDGKCVYVEYYGGIKGRGANAIACLDLDGKRIWSYFTGQTDVYEHGQHVTPALCGNYLIYLSGKQLFAFDKTNGKVVWQKKTPGFGNVAGASMVALKSGGVDMVLAPHAGIFRVSDGTLLWKTDVRDDTVTPALVDGLIYGPNYGFSAVEQNAFFYVMKVPAPVGDTVKPEFLVRKPWKDIAIKLPGGSNSALEGSPLYDDGLVYIVSEGGGLTVVDTKTGTAAYTKALENLNPRLTWVYVVGVCTGPTLAGKYIHIRDDQSQTLVIAPGREYKELAKNVLWELKSDGNQQEAQSNPWYEGGRIYYRTQGFLYCIGEK